MYHGYQSGIGNMYSSKFTEKKISKHSTVDNFSNIGEDDNEAQT